MILFASAGFSVRDAQAGENRGGIAAHKYEGLTSFQRTIPPKEERLRRRRSLQEILRHAEAPAAAVKGATV